MTRTERSRRDQLMIRSALCGAVATALLAAGTSNAAVNFPQTPAGLLLATAGATAPTTANLGKAGNSICAGGAACLPNQLAASPTGGTITPPQITFYVNTNRAIINWQQFDLNSGGTAATTDHVTFDFNSRDDIVINLINSPTATATQINGFLTGQTFTTTTVAAQFNDVIGPRVPVTDLTPGGNIWIVNPAGVVFGAHAVVNTGGLLASTVPLTAGDQTTFLGGGDTTTFTFSGPSPAASSVVLQKGALITGYGGTLAFIAPVVVTKAGAKISGAAPTAGCVLDTTPCGTDVLYGTASEFSITFAPNANNDLDLFSFIVPTGGGSTATTPMNLGGVTGAGNVYIAAVNQAGVVGAVVAPGAVTATNAGGSNGDIVLSVGGGIENNAGAITTPATTGAGQTNVRVGGTFTADRLTDFSGNGQFNVTAPLTTNAGDLDIASTGVVNTGGAALNAGGVVNITGSSFIVGSVSSDNGINLTANGTGAAVATSTAGTLTSFGAITVNTTGDFDLTTSATTNNTDLGSDIDITSVGAVNAGGATLLANNANINVTGDTFHIGSATANVTTLKGTGAGASSVTTLATSVAGDLTITTAGPFNAPNATLSSTLDDTSVAPPVLGNVFVTASSFNIGTASAPGQITLTADGAGAAGTGRVDPATGGSITVNTNGDFTLVSTLTATTGGLTLNVGGTVIAPSGTLITQNAGAGQLTVNSGAFDIGTATSAAGLTLNAAGAATSTAGALTSAQQLTVNTVGEFDLTTSATSTAGGLTINAGASGAGAFFNAPNATLQTTAGQLTVNAGHFDIGTATSGAGLTLNGSDSSASTAGVLTAAQDLTVNVVGDINLTTSATSTGGNLTVNADIPGSGSALNAAAATLSAANGNVTVNSGTFDVGTATSQATTLSATGVGASGVTTLATSTIGNLTITAAGPLNAGGATLSATGFVPTNFGPILGNVDVTAASFNIGTATALGKVNLTATGAAADQTGTITGGTGVTVNTGGAFTLTGTATATTGNLQITAVGDFSAANAPPTGSLLPATLSAPAGDVTVSAATFDINSASSGVTTLTSTGTGPDTIGGMVASTAGDLAITAGGPLTATNATLSSSTGKVTVSAVSFDIGTVDAAGAATLTATGPGAVGTGKIDPIIAASININTTGDFTLLSTATATAGDLDVTAGGAINAGGATFTATLGNINLSGASFDVGTSTAGLATSLTATTGAGAIGVSATSDGGNLTISTAGPLSAGAATLFATRTVGVTSSSFDIGTARGLLIDLTANGTGGLTATSTAGVLAAPTGINVSTTGDFDLTTSATASTARQPGNIVITSQGAVAAGGAVLTAAFGDITVQSLTFDIGSATSRVTSLTATGSAPSAVETLATSTAGDLDVTAAGSLNAGAATLSSTGVGGNVNVSAADFTIGTATAPALVNLTATGSGASQAGTVTGGTGVKVNTGGAFTITTALTATTGNLAVTDGGAFTSTGASVTAAAGTASVIADTFTIDSVSSLTTTLKATGSGADAINIAATSTVGDLDITAIGPLSAGAATLTGNGSVNLTAASFTVGTATANNGAVNLTANGTGALLSASSAGVLTGPTGVTVTTTGDFNLATSATAGNGKTVANLTITAGGAVNAGAATLTSTLGNVTVTGVSFNVGVTTAGQSASLAATGGSGTVGSVTGGTGVTLASATTMTVANAATATTGNLAITAGGPLTATNAVLSAPVGTATVNAVSFDIGQVTSRATTLTASGVAADTIGVSATSTAGDLDITTAGALDAPTAPLTATGAVNVGSATFDLGSVTAGSAANLTATSAAASQAGPILGGTGVAINTGGAFTALGNITATTGNLGVTAGGAVSAAGLQFQALGGNVTVSGVSFNVGSATAGGTASLAATGGNGAVGTAIGGTGVTLTSTANMTVTNAATATTGNLSINAGGLLIATNAPLSAPAGDATVLAAGFDIGQVSSQVTTLTATGTGPDTIGGPAASTAGDLDITTAGPLTAATGPLTATGAVNFVTTSFNLGPVAAGGAVNINGSGAAASQMNTVTGGTDVTITTGGALTGNGNVTATSGNLSITAGGAFAAPGATLSATAGAATISAVTFDIGTLTAGSATLTGTGTGADVIEVSATATTGDLDSTTAGPLTAPILAATAANLNVVAPSFNIGSASAGLDVNLTGSGAAASQGGTVTAGDNVNIATGGDFDLATSATANTGSLTITAGGAVNAGGATLSATNNDFVVNSVTVTATTFNIGTVNGGYVFLTANGPGANTLGAAFTAGICAPLDCGNGGLIQITTVGSLTATTLSAPGTFGDVIVSAGPNGNSDPAEFITIGQANAGGDLTLQGGAVSLTGASSGGAVLVRTGAFTLTEPLTGGTGGVTIASTAGALNLGDNVQGGATGLNISDATFGEISTPGAVTLYAGDPGNATLGLPGGTARGDLTVGTLPVNGASVGSLVLLAGNGNNVVFTGAATSAGSTPATLVVGDSGAWSPNAVYIEAAGASGGGTAGSIGTAAAPFGSVTFNALNDIIMGTPGFIQAVSGTQGSQINVTLGSPSIPTGDGAAPGEVLLAAQTATFLADGRIVQQNTAAGNGFAGLLIETPAGATGSLFLGCLTCATHPGVIDLFGSIDSPTGAAVTGPGAALSPLIVLVTPLEKDVDYRFNGCIIGDAGDCQPGAVLPQLTILDNLPPDVFAELPEPPPLLTPGDYEGQADVTIIGSGNEEIWRKPEGSKK